MHPQNEASDRLEDSAANNPADNANKFRSGDEKQHQTTPSAAPPLEAITKEDDTATRNAHLSEPERKLILLIESNNDATQIPKSSDTNEQLAIELVESGSIPDANFCDSTNTTPLQHAAFRGRQRLVHVLLERGADVNDDRQTQGYTALMFGALSGRPGVCQQLLEYGARASYINRVGKTASQLAAFCGQHACAAAINNFVSRDMIEYYTEPRGLETEPLLAPAKLVGPLHRLAIQTNLHPVHLLNIMMSTKMDEDEEEDLPLLLVPAYSKRAVRVLNAMLEKQIKGTAERSMSINECAALKFHFLASFLNYVRELQEQQHGEGTLGSKQKSTAAQQIAHLQQHFLKGSAPFGFCGVIDQFICELLRKFPYATQSPLLLQLVRQITQSLRTGSAGSDDGTTHQQQSTTSIALVHFLTTINGQRFFADDDDICAACGSLAPGNRKCSSCKMLSYCNAQCQKLHWFSHKKFCPTLYQERLAMQERARKYEEEKKRADEAAEKEKQRKEEEASRQLAITNTEHQQTPEVESEVRAVADETGSHQLVDLSAPAHVAEAVDAAAVEASISDSVDLTQDHNAVFGNFRKNSAAEVDASNQGEDVDDDKQPLINPAMF